MNFKFFKLLILFLVFDTLCELKNNQTNILNKKAAISVTTAAVFALVGLGIYKNRSMKKTTPLANETKSENETGKATDKLKTTPLENETKLADKIAADKIAADKIAADKIAEEERLAAEEVDEFNVGELTANEEENEYKKKVTYCLSLIKEAKKNPVFENIPDQLFKEETLKIVYKDLEIKEDDIKNYIDDDSNQLKKYSLNPLVFLEKYIKHIFKEQELKKDSTYWTNFSDKYIAKNYSGLVSSIYMFSDYCEEINKGYKDEFDFYPSGLKINKEEGDILLEKKNDDYLLSLVKTVPIDQKITLASDLHGASIEVVNKLTMVLEIGQKIYELIEKNELTEENIEKYFSKYSMYIYDGDFVDRDDGDKKSLGGLCNILVIMYFYILNEQIKNYCKKKNINNKLITKILLRSQIVGVFGNHETSGIFMDNGFSKSFMVPKKPKESEINLWLLPEKFEYFFKKLFYQEVTILYENKKSEIEFIDNFTHSVCPEMGSVFKLNPNEDGIRIQKIYKKFNEFTKREYFLYEKLSKTELFKNEKDILKNMFLDKGIHYWSDPSVENLPSPSSRGGGFDISEKYLNIIRKEKFSDFGDIKIGKVKAGHSQSSSCYNDLVNRDGKVPNNCYNGKQHSSVGINEEITGVSIFPTGNYGCCYANTKNYYNPKNCSYITISFNKDLVKDIGKANPYFEKI